MPLQARDLEELKVASGNFDEHMTKKAQTILTGCAFNWDEVRSLLLRKNRNSSIQDMYIMLEYRRRSVNAIIEQVARETKCEGRVTGSAELTSDYDITFEAPPGDPEPAKIELEAVRSFNAHFKAFCRQEFRMSEGSEPPSGIMFDTNAYAKGEHLAGVTPKFVTREEADRDLRGQNEYALLKARKYMGTDEWNGFMFRVEAAGMNRVGLLRNIARSVENRYSDVLIAPIYERLHALDPVAVPNSSGEPSVFEKERQTGDVEAFARENPVEFSKLTDSLYLDRLEKAARLRSIRDFMRSPAYLDAGSNQAAALEAVVRANGVDPRAFALTEEEFTRALNAADSDARIMANEAYFSRGALRHILPEFRAKDDQELSVHDLFQSMNEQLGDALKKLRDHGETEPAAPNPAPGDREVEAEQTAVARICASVKYIERLVAAGKDLLKKLPGSPPEDVMGELQALERMSPLKMIAKDAATPKMDVRTASNLRKQMAAQDIMKRIGVDPDVARLRARLIKIAEAVNLAYFGLSAATSESPVLPRGLTRNVASGAGD